MRSYTLVANSLLALIMALGGGPKAGAQIVGVHGIYVPARDGRRSSTGVEAEVGRFLPVPLAEAMLSLAVEYQREDSLRTPRGRVAAQLRLFRGHANGVALPFIGGSISANQSNGALSEWPGTRLGLEAMAGLILVPKDGVPVALVLEERFGYVRGQSHGTATHVGLMLTFY